MFIKTAFPRVSTLGKLYSILIRLEAVKCQVSSKPYAYYRQLRIPPLNHQSMLIVHTDEPSFNRSLMVLQLR